MILEFNPQKLRLAQYPLLMRKFYVDQTAEELKAEILMQLGAEEIILNFQQQTIVAWRAGHDSDDFAQNKISVLFYHTSQ